MTTVIGGSKATTAVAPSINTFVTPLTSTATTAVDPQVQKIVQSVDFGKTASQDISLIGAEVQLKLQKTLDEFLDRVDKNSNPRIIKLVKTLQDTVQKEDLNSLADRILNGELSFGDKFIGFFSKKSLVKAAETSWEKTKNLVEGKTTTLRNVISQMENELLSEQKRLYNEVTVMDTIKQSYHARFDEFAILVKAMNLINENAKQFVDNYVSTMDTNDPQQNFQLQEYKTKLRALDSRCLALEGILVSIPSQQLTFTQLIEAGIDTLQESTTTAAVTFTNIKNTLLVINSAMVIKDSQALSAAHQAIDQNLQDVSQKLLRDVIVTAAGAAGNNRLAQANRIKSVIEETDKLADVTAKLHEENVAKFAEARQSYAESKQKMLDISKKVNV